MWLVGTIYFLYFFSKDGEGSKVATLLLATLWFCSVPFAIALSRVSPSSDEPLLSDTEIEEELKLED